ncbi:MAG: PepSY domain-containing protein [Halothiobacillaceae bacterium]|nr:PepSY domain-containing protein [Halothiobacillaceae bacterium]
MQRNVKILSAIALISTLVAGTAFATSAVQLPDEVKSSSIKLPRGAESQADLLQHAKITQQEAEAAALAALPGQVVKSKLDDEDGYLVWQVDIKHPTGITEITIDAGNGQALAAEVEDNDDHGNDRKDERGENGTRS